MEPQKKYGKNIKCKYCGGKSGKQVCSRCFEIERRVRDDRALVIKILDAANTP
jgi:hypothetical protein